LLDIFFVSDGGDYSSALFSILKMTSSKTLEETKLPFDLSLYLVTDSTPAILQGRSLFRIVELALEGG
jgi:hypothetical protein